MVSTLNIPLLTTPVCDVLWLLLGSSIQKVLTDLQPPAGQRLRMPADSLWASLWLMTKPVQGERVCFGPQFTVLCGGESTAAGAWSSWWCYIYSQEESNEGMAAAQPSLHLYKPGAQPGEWCHPQWAGLPTLMRAVQISLPVWGAVGSTHYSCNTSARVGTLTWQIGVTIWRVHHGSAR